MNFVGKFLTKAWRAAVIGLWCAVGLWGALAVYFTAAWPRWMAAAAGLAIAALFLAALPERREAALWLRAPWRTKRRSLAALAAWTAVAVYYFGFVIPDPNQEWSPEQARMPIVEIDGDLVRVQNVRDFTWHTASAFTEGFYDRVYDLSRLVSMYYVVAPMPSLDGVAHVFVSFGFSDGQHVAVSVEGRRTIHRPYQLLPSLFRQYQLIYIIGDERDVIGLRGAIWKKPVFFYPARTTGERKRAIFLDMIKRAHDLEEHPEFYHLIFNNCMNNITSHLRRLGGRPVPHDLRVLLTGFSDRVAYRYGYIDTDLPFDVARRVFRIDGWMQQTPLDEGFSKRLREHLAAAVDEARDEIEQGRETAAARAP